MLPYAVETTTTTTTTATKSKMNQSDNISQFLHLPGFRFSPTDEELVDYYLRQKMLGQDHRVTEIAEVNIYSFKPRELPGKSVIKSNIPEWYFFVPRIYKYGKSQRSRRTTECGYWKVTGEPRKVVKGKEVIAYKKSLVFYTGRTPNGVRTNWIIHEYNPTFNVPNQQKEYVVCKLMAGSDDIPTLEENESFPDQLSSNVGDGQYSSNETGGTSNYGGRTGFSNCVPQEDDQLQAHLNSFHGYNEMDYNLSYAMSYKKYM